MDVTPQLLQEIEFREKVRGYHPDDVDDFLERVGVAFSELVDRLRQANERADAAESELAEQKTMDESALTRTLVLAQKTADAAIAEAETEAARMVTEAETEAARTVGNAETEASRMVAEARTERDEMLRRAEAEAKEEAAAATDEIRTELDRLEARRDALVTQSTGMEDWVAAQRMKLESVARDLQVIVDDPDRLSIDPAPAVPALDEPSVAAHSEQFSAPSPTSEDVHAGHPVADHAGPEDAVPASDESDDPGSEPSDAGAAGVASGDAAETGPSLADLPPPSGAPAPESSTASVSMPQPDLLPSGDAGPPTSAAPLRVDLDSADRDDEMGQNRPGRVSVVRTSIQAEDPDDSPTTGSGDSFLEELRRAVEAPTDLVESEEDRALSAFFEQDEDEPKRRFGRRK